MTKMPSSAPHYAMAPSDRLLALGASALTDAELVAMLVRDRLATPDALYIAEGLMDRFHDLTAMSRVGVAEMVRQPGLGARRAARLCAAFEFGRRALAPTPSSGTAINRAELAAHLIQRELSGLRREAFAGLFMDTRNRLLRAEVLFLGTINIAPVFPREVVVRALELGATGVVIGHNHPSGQLEPSEADRRITRVLEQALGLVEVGLHDHIIVAGEHYVSLRELGWPQGA